MEDRSHPFPNSFDFSKEKNMALISYSSDKVASAKREILLYALARTDN